VKRILEGGCQCGAVRYRYEGEVLNIFVCHCTDCQKQSGSAFGMGLWLYESELRRLSGKLRTWVRRLPSNQDMLCEFCETCGTRVFHTSESNRAAGIISIKPGTLDDTSWLEPFTHIWTTRAQPWVRYKEGAKLYEYNPPSLASLASKMTARNA
jgi:hypothetical protein